jgi:hypothetical protein
MGYIQTTVIILICIGLTTSSLLTFCENDASYCNNPNLYELGSINFEPLTEATLNIYCKQHWFVKPELQCYALLILAFSWNINELYILHNDIYWMYVSFLFKSSSVTHSWLRSDFSPLIKRDATGRQILVVTWSFESTPIGHDDFLYCQSN